MSTTQKNAPSGNSKTLLILGWGIVIIALLYTTIAYIDLSSDGSSQAFAPLVLFEGGFFVIVGLVVLFIGYRKMVKSRNH